MLSEPVQRRPPLLSPLCLSGYVSLEFVEFCAMCLQNRDGGSREGQRANRAPVRVNLKPSRGHAWRRHPTLQRCAQQRLYQSPRPPAHSTIVKFEMKSVVLSPCHDLKIVSLEPGGAFRRQLVLEIASSSDSPPRDTRTTWMGMIRRLDSWVMLLVS